MTTFDVVVIGGGPGGYTAAVRASQLGLKTALIEKEQMGGTCLNWGCIPTKALLRNAEIIYQLSKGRDFGFSFSDLKIDYAEAHKRSRSIVSRQTKRVDFLMRQNGITVYKDQAKLNSSKEVILEQSGQKITGKNIIIATGAAARSLPGISFDNSRILNNRQALSLTRLPPSIIIVGAGPIGMEFATLWNRFGANVTVVEMMDRLLPLEDNDVSIEIQKQFKRSGIETRIGARVTSVEPSTEGVDVSIITGEKQETLFAQTVLVSIGFEPNSRHLGLENIGVTTVKGNIAVDDRMCSNVSNIFAVGDVNGKMGLAHVASAQAIIAAEAITGKSTAPLVYENISRCTFTHPEVSSVGLSEAQAKEQGYEVVTSQCPLVANGKAVAMGENFGFVKIVADNQNKKLLGLHAIGDHVTEIVAGMSGMLSVGVNILDLATVIFPHPTISEAVMEATHKLCGYAIHI